MKNSITKGYVVFLEEIKQRIRASQYEALKAVNHEMIRLYWDIGRMIVEKQEKEGWGKAVVESLAGDLQKEFPGMRGYSARNIWYMWTFYTLYRQNEKLQPLVAEISWSKHLVVIDRCKDDLEREFYIHMTRKLGWTKNVLIHQIENKTYEKTLLNQTNFHKTLPEKIKSQAGLAVKDEYTFDFLELGEEHSEMELERALIARVNRFLAEMGGAFAFLGNQYRLELQGNEYFVDLLFFNRKLKCLVAVELKTGEFKPEYAGKMDFYLHLLNDKVRFKDENPSIGIILCAQKKNIVVEYALRSTRNPVGVAEYKLTRKLPVGLKKYLPSEKDLIAQVSEEMKEK